MSYIAVNGLSNMATLALLSVCPDEHPNLQLVKNRLSAK